MRRRDRGRQLLQVAEEVIAERGFQAASMDEIAVRAGVTKPVLYDHFGSKDGLLAAVIARAGGQLREAVQRAVTDAEGPEEELARGVHAYFEFIEEHAPTWSSLLGEAAAMTAAAGAVEEIRKAAPERTAKGVKAPGAGMRSRPAKRHNREGWGACMFSTTITGTPTPHRPWYGAPARTAARTR